MFSELRTPPISDSVLGFFLVYDLQSDSRLGLVSNSPPLFCPHQLGLVSTPVLFRRLVPTLSGLAAASEPLREFSPGSSRHHSRRNPSIPRKD